MKTNLKSMKKMCAVLSVLLFMLLTNTAFAFYNTNTVVFTNEFWISTNTSSENLGTLDKPYICATEPEFDNTMSNMPPNCTIHILAGTYQTLGFYQGFSLQTGQKILGSGIDVTVIQLDTNAQSGSSVMGGPTDSILGTEIEISDLTLNCEGTSSGNTTYGGLQLYGDRMAVRRVKVVNLVGYTSESFGIGINASAGAQVMDSQGNIIEECEVSNFVAETSEASCSAITLDAGGTTTSAISGIIRNNRVFLSPKLTPESYQRNYKLYGC
jgi:hypothetical protein